MTLPKRLKYDNRFLDALVQATPNEVAFLPISEQVKFPDQTTKKKLIWDVSLDEWTMVFSSMCTGADLLYGDGAINICEIFLRTVAQEMDICDLVAACIDSPNVQSAILNLISENGFANSNAVVKPLPLPESETGNNLLPSGYTCDTSHLCGMARSIVNSANDNTTELLQALEEGTDPLELVAIFVDNFEGVSWFGGAIEFGSWLQDELIENYDAAWSPAVENILTCALYCKIEPDCSVSLDLILSAYAEFISETITLPDPTDIEAIWVWLTDVVFGTVGASAFVAAFHWCAWQTLRFGGNLPVQFMGLRSLRDTVIEAEDETDTYCDTLPCDCVVPTGDLCYFVDFTSGLGDWQLIDNNGTLESGGVTSELNLSNQPVVSIFIDAGEGYIWGGVDVNYDWSGSSGGADNLIIRGYDTFASDGTNTGEVGLYSQNNIPEGSDLEICIPDVDVSETAKRYLRIIMINVNAFSTDVIVIRNIRLFKQTAPPVSIDSNCTEYEC